MIDKHHQEEDEHNQHVNKRKSRQKGWRKEMIEAKGLDPKPVEIDGFRKSKITQQKEACPDKGYGHHQAHQRAVKQRSIILRSKAKRKKPGHRKEAMARARSNYSGKPKSCVQYISESRRAETSKCYKNSSPLGSMYIRK